jgi:DNA-binding NarL/FixJ family response regulator
VNYRNYRVDYGVFIDETRAASGYSVVIKGVETMASLSDLTPRELEILRLLVAGQTNKAIAGEIYISERTVQFHLDHIYNKVGARTRLMVGIWAIQQGLCGKTRDFNS